MPGLTGIKNETDLQHHLPPAKWANNSSDKVTEYAGRYCEECLLQVYAWSVLAVNSFIAKKTKTKIKTESKSDTLRWALRVQQELLTERAV